ncbi:hypothetical protein JCM11641_001534 [Rhodosporidiobolus odoratus]
MAQNPQQDVDHFSRLPRDILTSIFEWAYGCDAYASPKNKQRIASLVAPISKRLLPLQREQLFGYLDVGSAERLSSLCTLVMLNADIAKAIKNLDINLGWSWCGGFARPVKVEAVHHLPSVDSLRRLFNALINLQDLSVVGSSRVAQAAMDPIQAPKRFRELTSLFLQASFDAFSDPFNVAHLVGLSHWAKLESFTYKVEREEASVHIECIPGSYLLPLWPPDPLPSFPSITGLRVTGPLSKSIVLLSLLKTMPSLTSLALFDSYDPGANFVRDLFKALPNPSLLESLRFERSAPTHPSDLGPFLPSLTRLQSLVVGGEGVQIKKSSYDAFHKLPLTFLWFTLGLKGVFSSELVKLVKGADKHPTLRRIDLDHIKMCAHEGHFAEWTKRFSPHTFQKFLDAAEAEGVEVQGDACDALMDYDDSVPFDELLDGMEMYKERYANFARGLEENPLSKAEVDKVKAEVELAIIPRGRSV